MTASDPAASPTPEGLHAARVVAAAASWIGTPYRHQGSRKGVGCDCLGLVRGVWRDLVGPEPAPLAPYTPDWAEMRDDDPLLEAMRRHLVPNAAHAAGTVLVLRWRTGAAAKHCGILSAPDRMIHAYSGHGVLESPLTPSWASRVAARFAFPTEGPVPEASTVQE